jgi:hypothetical protein
MRSSLCFTTSSCPHTFIEYTIRAVGSSNPPIHHQRADSNIRPYASMVGGLSLADMSLVSTR